MLKKVLHIGHSKGWRGGENQAFLLMEGLSKQYPDIQNYLAYPRDAEIIQRVKKNIVSMNNAESILEFSSEKIISIRSLLKLLGFCRTHRVDILHAHSAKAHSLCCVVKKFLPSVNIVVHRRVDIPIKTSYFTRKKYLTQNVDAFIAVSSKTYQVLNNYGIDSNKIYLVKDGIPPQVYSFADKLSAKRALLSQLNERKKISLDASLPLVGFVSAFDEKKNPLLFVDMVFELKQRGVILNAVMAGIGKLEHQVQEKIVQLGLSENVQLLGFVENIKDVFQGLDIFVLSSRSEGLGTVLLEAALAECAIVASEVGGVGEVIKDKQTGFLAVSDSIQSFADAIAFIVQNSEEINDMKRSAKQFIENDFSLQRVVTDTHDVYNHFE